MFGSAIGRTVRPDTSDVDVVVDASPVPSTSIASSRWKEGLEATGRSVDVVLASGMANLYFSSRSSRLESCSTPRDPRTHLWDAHEPSN